MFDNIGWVVIPTPEISSSMSRYSFAAEQTAKSSFEFPLNINKNSHKQNFGKITSTAIPFVFSKVERM
jgi:hypothetical protein